MERPNINFVYDGQIHRFHVDGDKSNTKNGWYLAKPNGWIVYSTWRECDNRYYINKDGTELTPDQRKQFRKDIAIEQKLIRLRQDDAARDLKSIIDAADVKSHPYLAKKGFANIKGYIVKDALVIPICDISRNYSKIISLQYIYPDGSKRFSRGCRTKGGVHIISTDTTCNNNLIYLCEGYATGLTVSLATNSIVAVCFYATNIIHVAELLKTRFPEDQIIICADNDRNTQGNPGVSEAMKTSKKLLIKMFIPDLSNCSPNATDFNDLMIEKSIEAVRKQLNC